MNVEHWQNDSEREDRGTLRVTCPSATLSITNLSWPGPWIEPVLRRWVAGDWPPEQAVGLYLTVGRPQFNRLSTET